MECPHLALWTEYINYLKKADKTRNEIVSAALLFSLDISCHFFLPHGTPPCALFTLA
jgi:hypothetical protein